MLWDGAKRASVPQAALVSSADEPVISSVQTAAVCVEFRSGLFFNDENATLITIKDDAYIHAYIHTIHTYFVSIVFDLISWLSSTKLTSYCELVVKLKATT